MSCFEAIWWIYLNETEMTLLTEHEWRCPIDPNNGNYRYDHSSAQPCKHGWDLKTEINKSCFSLHFPSLSDYPGWVSIKAANTVVLICSQCLVCRWSWELVYHLLSNKLHSSLCKIASFLLLNWGGLRYNLSKGLRESRRSDLAV